MKPTHITILIAALLSSSIPIASAAAAATEELRGRVTRRVEAEYSSPLGIYTNLHAHPELSFMEVKTAALEGTMLGPGLLMGRIAALDVVTHLKSEGKLSTKNYVSSPPAKSPATKLSDPESLRACREVLRQLVTQPRPGYLHFEKAHAVVLEQNFDCVRCHREPSPLALNADQLDRRALIQACVICHGSVKE